MQAIAVGTRRTPAKSRRAAPHRSEAPIAPAEASASAGVVDTDRDHAELESSNGASENTARRQQLPSTQLHQFSLQQCDTSGQNSEHEANTDLQSQTRSLHHPTAEGDFGININKTFRFQNFLTPRLLKGEWILIQIFNIARH